jgi:L-alanine-DL-glutamate epimerase-like enolase superfamily enzyme
VPPTADLGTTLAALPVVIEEVTGVMAPAAVPSYPGGTRPSSVVRLGGGAAVGHGEHVGWDEAAHRAFHDRLADVPRGSWHVGAWSAAVAARGAPPYDRAALEAAAIDLALRQRGTSLLALAGVASGSVRYVVSFERVADPVAVARTHPHVALKIDVDPAWDDTTFAALAALGRVAVLDWKDTGAARDHERAHATLPDALLEDPRPDAVPWSASLRARLSFDAPLTTVVDLDRLPARPVAVNLKPARMGGVLAALACAARCAERGIDVYLGGMFEVGVGRAQLRALAAVLSPDGPNDIAPIPVGERAAERPVRLSVDARPPGFGGVTPDSAAPPSRRASPATGRA